MDEASSDLVARGAAITRRRMRLGFKGVQPFAKALGLDRTTLTKIESGQTSRLYEVVEAKLDALEEEMGMDDPDQGPESARGGGDRPGGWDARALPVRR